MGKRVTGIFDSAPIDQLLGGGSWTNSPHKFKTVISSTVQIDGSTVNKANWSQEIYIWSRSKEKFIP